NRLNNWTLIDSGANRALGLMRIDNRGRLEWCSTAPLPSDFSTLYSMDYGPGVGQLIYDDNNNSKRNGRFLAGFVDFKYLRKLPYLNVPGDPNLDYERIFLNFQVR